MREERVKPPLPVRRFDIRLARTAGRLALCLPLGQQAHQPGQTVQFAALPGDDIGKVVHSACQMGNTLFPCLIAHPRTPPLAHHRPKG